MEASHSANHLHRARRGRGVVSWDTTRYDTAMNQHFLKTSVVFALIGACASSPAPAPEAPVAEPAPQPAPVAEPAPEKPAEPTPEEKAKAAAAAQLEQDRAKMLADHEAELKRFTPELRAEVKPLAEKAYPSTKAAMKAVLVGKHRKPGHPERDAYRHPAETLEFLGLKPNMTVLEYSPGEGWYTEVLAPTLATKGKLLATNGDPNGPVTERSTYYAQRFKLFLDTSPELYGKVETVTVGKTPALGLEGTLDMVLLFRAAHGMVNGGSLNAWLAEMHKALKKGGVLGIEQHRAAADAKPEDSAKLGYLPEAWLIAQVEAAGFKLQKKSEINANPKDTKDYPDGVWTLPPSYRLGDKDREKYTAIGESDRMTLKFVKVEPKKVKAPASAAAAPAAAAPATPAPATK